MVLVTAVARLKPEAREEALAAAERMQAASSAEPGCQEYGFWFAIDDPNRLLVFERWDDAEALDTHLAKPHVAEFAAAIGGFLDGAPEITRFEVASAGPFGV